MWGREDREKTMHALGLVSVCIYIILLFTFFIDRNISCWQDVVLTLLSSPCEYYRFITIFFYSFLSLFFFLTISSVWLYQPFGNIGWSVFKSLKLKKLHLRFVFIKWDIISLPYLQKKHKSLFCKDNKLIMFHYL